VWCAVNSETRNWLASAEYDLQTARDMLKSGRYLYVVFMCHLAIEKTLEALVCEATSAAPPRIHDLERLSQLAGVALAPRLEQFIAELTDASITTRYPEDLARMVSKYPESVASSYMQRTEEVTSWLASDPRLQPPSPAT